MIYSLMTVLNSCFFVSKSSRITALFLLSFSPDDSKQEKRKKKKKKKRNAAIVAIEEDDNHQDFTSGAKEFPLNDSSLKESFNSNSECKSFSLGHTRSSSYPGNITVVSEGSEMKSSRVDGQEVVFTEISKSISLPDNSIPVENIAEGNQTKSKDTIFNLDEFLENITVEPRYDTVGEGVQEAPEGEDTGNFVFGTADLFLKQPNVDQQEKSSQFQENKQTTSTAISTGNKISSDSVLVDQEIWNGKETDLVLNRSDSGSESFEINFSSTPMTHYSKDGEEDLSGVNQNKDFSHVYSLNDDRNEESNFSVTQMQISGTIENTTADHYIEASNVSQDTNAINAQDNQDYGDIPSENTSQQERITENEELYENTGNELDDFESGASPELQPASNNGKVEPVVLMDSGECLVPVAEGDMTSKTGAQSTFYLASDVSAENDRDSLSRSVGLGNMIVCLKLHDSGNPKTYSTGQK